MAKRNQYNKPGNFNQIPRITFAGGATFSSSPTVVVSGAIGGSAGSTTITAAVNAGDIVAVTQTTPMGTINFDSVTLGLNQSFSVVLTNNRIKSSSLGASTIITTLAFEALPSFCRATLSASSAGEAKIAVASSALVVAGNTMQINYMIVGGSN